MIRWSEKAINLSRRRFLVSAGGAALAMPFLSSLRMGNAHADPTPPRRLIVFWTPDGFERGTPQGFNSTSPNQLAFAPGSVLEPLKPYINDLVLLEKLRVQGQGGSDTNVHYGIRQVLTGSLYSDQFGGAASSYASIDQFLGKTLRSQTKFPSLEVGVQSTPQFQTYGNLSYQDGGVAVARENDPRGVFKRIFLGLFLDPGLAGKIFAEQKSVLDSTQDDLKQIMSQVSAEDRVKLQSHADAYRDLEKALAPISTTCNLPQNPTTDLTKDYLKCGQFQTKLMVMALQCDLMRVATIQWSYPVSNMPSSFCGFSDDGHSLGHQLGDNWQMKRDTLQRWYASRFGDLLRQLQAVPEGAGTTLSNSAVMWCSEFDDHPENHEVSAMPVLLAGECGGYLHTGGRIIDCKGRYTNDLLTTLTHAMAVPLPGNTFGDASLCAGEIAGIKT